MERLVRFNGAADKLKLPLRLAFYIKDARPSRLRRHQTRQRVVVAVLLTIQRLERYICRVLIPAAPALNRTDSVCSLPSDLITIRGYEGLTCILYIQPQVPVLISEALKRYLRRQLRIGENPRGNLGIDKLDIWLNFSRPKPTVWIGIRYRRISLNVGRSIPPAIVGAIAEQDHRPNRQASRLVVTCLSASPEPRCRSVAFSSWGYPAVPATAGAIKSNLKFLVQVLDSVEDSVGLILARRPLPSAAILRESSATTATIFCWGRSVATLNAGCHSINRSIASVAVWRVQIAMGRRSNRARRRTSGQAKPAAPTNRRAISSHTGHRPRRTTLPLGESLERILKQKLKH